MKDFHDRFVEAIRRRIYPNTALHLKQLAGEIGRSESSVTRWWRGETRILAEDLERIAVYFSQRGDRNFAREIFMPELLETSPPDDEELIRLLRRMLGSLSARDSASAGETHLWVTDRGAIVAAPFGHAEYAARALRLPPDRGDLIRYTTGIVGWIAVTMRANHDIAIRHDGRQVATLAAESLCNWLMNRRSAASTITRSIQIDGKWLEAKHDTVERAIEALQKVAFIVRKPRRPWTVKRLPLDSIRNERLTRLLQIHRETPDQLIHRAAEIGAFTDSSMCSVEGENVISLYVAPKYLISREALEGQNIMAIPDTDYAMMVRARILQAKREGPIYCDLSGTVNDENLHYLNLALPEPGPHGKVLTSTVILEREIVG